MKWGMNMGEWIVACNGLEKPFQYHGYTYLYMWNTKTRQHAYYCTEHDLFYKDFRTQELAE